MKHKIAVICTHYNHLDIFPFVYDYWKRFADHIYVFDNGSNDGSLENFKKYEDFITVTDFSHMTGGKLNDIVNIGIKNQYWKRLKNDYDYIMICDFDEALYCDDLDRILDICDEQQIGMIYPKYCESISEEWVDHVDDKLYHELNPYCHNKDNTTILNKKDFNDVRMFIINPKIVIETNYFPGQNINKAVSTNNKLAKINNIYVFHLHYLGLDHAKKIHETNKATLSDANKKYRLGIQYLNDNDIQKYQERLNNKIEYYNYKYEGYSDF